MNNFGLNSERQKFGGSLMRQFNACHKDDALSIRRVVKHSLCRVPRLIGRNHRILQRRLRIVATSPFDLIEVDFELYELHEAFASTVLATLAAWESDGWCRERLGLDGSLGTIDRARLNVTGSSLAAGHPFAATGGRIVATIAKLLHERGPGARGLVSVCAAGGQGVVAILEAV